MDWTMMGALGEIAGALAVVVSLVYLARQVRLSNALARAEAYRVVSLRASELLSAWATDDGFLPVVRSGIVKREAGLGDLTPDEQTKALLHYAAAIRIFETIHRHVESGMLRPDAYEIFGGMMFRTPLFEDVWARLEGAYAEDFAAVMEEKFGVSGHLDSAG
jgi:hypothetical protein